METRPLGQTGVNVSILSLGSRPFSGGEYQDGYGAVTQEEVTRVVLEALKQGINRIDTAPHFGRGNAERLIGNALLDIPRIQYLLTSQGGIDWESASDSIRPNFSESHLRRSLEESLKRLNTDHLDIYLLHTPHMELIHAGKIFETLQKFKTEKLAKFVGISIHDPMEGIKALETQAIDVIQAPYHLFDRRIEKQLLATCEAQNIGLLIREPLANGFLAGQWAQWHRFDASDFRSQWTPLYINKRIQAADAFKALLNPTKDEPEKTLASLSLRWAARHPSISSLSVGCRSIAHLAENVAALNPPPLSDVKLAEIDALCARL